MSEQFEGPAKVVRQILNSRLDLSVIDQKQAIYQCGSNALRLLPKGCRFVLFSPITTNRPVLWDDVLTRMGNAPLLFTKAVKLCPDLHTWVVPPKVVARMDEILRINSENEYPRDSDIKYQEQDKGWYWQPADCREQRRSLCVTEFYQPLKLSSDELRELGNAFDRPRG